MQQHTLNKKHLWIAIGASLIFHVILIVFIRLYTPETLVTTDDWLYNLPLVRAQATGENPLPAIFAINNRSHISAPSRTTAYLLMELVNWNTYVAAAWAYILGVLLLILFSGMFFSKHPELMPILLVPFTALVLAVQQQYNWLWNFQTCWLYLVLFSMLTIHVFTRQPPSIVNLLLTALCALIASISLAPGFVMWGVILLGLYPVGYRGWKPYALWIGITIVVAIAYLNYPGMSLAAATTTPDGESTVGAVPFYHYILFILAFLGNIFTYGAQFILIGTEGWYENISNMLVAIAMTVFGGVVFVRNVIYLWQDEANRPSVTKAGLLALFSGTAATLTAVGRVPALGVLLSLQNQYMTASVPVWIGMFVLMTLTLRQTLGSEQRQQRRGLILSNLLIAVFAVVFYIYGAVGIFIVSEDREPDYQAMETCIREVAAGNTAIDGCNVHAGRIPAEWIVEMAEYDLAGLNSD